jgi:DNA gyrase/topoisomerase IV subunit B
MEKCTNKKYEKRKRIISSKQIGETTKRGDIVTFTLTTLFLLKTTEFIMIILSVCMRNCHTLIKELQFTFTDKRELLIKTEILFQKFFFYSDEGDYEYICYLDGNREPILHM